MVPNPHLTQPMEDPIKGAAQHFAAFLQTRGLLQGGDDSWGEVPKDQLMAQFVEHYQPQFRSRLVCAELLTSLRKHHVMLRPRAGAADLLRIKKTRDPHSVAVPNNQPRMRLYVDQCRVLRERLERVELGDEGRCRICPREGAFGSEESRRAHTSTQQHKMRLLYREKRSSFKSQVGGASISIVGEDNQRDMVLMCGERRNVTVQDNQRDMVLTCGERRNVTVQVTLESDYAQANVYKIIDLEEVTAGPLQFQDNLPIQVHVSAEFPEPGAYIFPLVAEVMPAKLCLLKDLIFRVCADQELVNQLAPTGRYEQTRKNVVKEMEGTILDGEALESRGKIADKAKIPLGGHNVPKVYNKLMVHKLQTFDGILEHEEEHLNNMLKLLCGAQSYKQALQHVHQTKGPFTEPLNADSYSTRFSLLLDLEELQQQAAIKQYDRSDQRLQPTSSGTRFLLQVEDLSEGRPSVTRGDKVHVRIHGENDFIYEGVIHEVREQGLLLGFHKRFGQEFFRLNNPKVDVCFQIQRFPLLNMHRAVKLIKKHHAECLVFPQPRRGTYFPPTNHPALRPWVNPLIGSNPEQQRAIEKIVSRASGSAPYLVFGPPGTGKTVTLVEAIAQVWLQSEARGGSGGGGFKQLVCAPSNAACNNIAARLIQALPPSAKIMRFFSLCVDESSVQPASLLNHANYERRSGIFMPDISHILKHDIIVVTIMTAGRLVTGGAGGEFRYVYIDECGQASEPEAVVAIAGVLTSARSPGCQAGQLVLAGDPRQLGPVLTSQLAVDFGLGMSLLERLMTQNPMYMKSPGSGYNNDYLTKLVQNFRSHPAILHLPNLLFYDDELKVKGNPDIINKAVGWSELPNKEFPIIFHGIQGIDEREKNSPSYFNRQEIDRVVTYIRALLGSGLPNYKVKEEDIGVITPYRKQVQKFKKAFELLRWKDIAVGSVEQFQGSEKLIIFISTVRSNVALVEEDYRFNLGFLKNPKRFNVSVSRAQALLIVVGNPNILRHDKQWHQLLKYCREHGATRGIPFPDEDPPDHQPLHVAH